MTTSLLTTRRDAIFTQMLAKLADAGYAYDPLTTSLDKYLATALAGLAGGTNLYKTRGRSRLLADLVTALGGSGNVLTQSELALVAEIVDASGGGPAPYHADAVHFDGATELDIASLTATDNALWSFSGWVLASSTHPGQTAPTVYVLDPNGDYSCYFEGNYFNVPPEVWGSNPSVNNAAATGFVTIDTNPSLWGEDVWLHWLFSFDGSTGAAKLYVSNVAVGTASPSGIPITLSVNGKGFSIGGDGGNGDFWTGDFSDIRIMPGVSLLDGGGDIPLATRRLFIDANGKPVDPAVATLALGAPCMLFSGNASGFGTNQGTGGAFTTTGTLTNASTSPSD